MPAELSSRHFLAWGQPAASLSTHLTCYLCPDFTPPLAIYKTEHSLSSVSINNKPSRSPRIFFITNNNNKVLNGLSYALIHGEPFWRKMRLHSRNWDTLWSGGKGMASLRAWGRDKGEAEGSTGFNSSGERTPKLQCLTTQFNCVNQNLPINKTSAI